MHLLNRGTLHQVLQRYFWPDGGICVFPKFFLVILRTTLQDFEGLSALRLPTTTQYTLAFAGEIRKDGDAMVIVPPFHAGRVTRARQSLPCFRARQLLLTAPFSF